MALYKKLDLWSVTDGLDKMMDYCFNGNEKDSPYWDYYCDQINELCNMASDLYMELDDLKSRLWYQMPAKEDCLLRGGRQQPDCYCLVQHRCGNAGGHRHGGASGA